jgi:hypothetical protein
VPRKKSERKARNKEFAKAQAYLILIIIHYVDEFLDSLLLMKKLHYDLKQVFDVLFPITNFAL